MGNVASIGPGVCAAGVDAVKEGGSAQNMVGNFTKKVVNKATNDVVEVLGTAANFSPEEIEATVNKIEE